MNLTSIICDDINKPSVMVKISKFLLSEIHEGAPDTVHPAFVKDGKVHDNIYISKYQNIVCNERAYSLQHQDPKVFITIDEARACCERKGPGWHLMTNAEWAAIALLAKSNDSMPRGNSDYGSAIHYPAERGLDAKGEPCPTEGKPSRILTGSGPKTWSHDGTEDGIYDLNGNVWEYVDGLYSRDGVVFSSEIDKPILYELENKVEDGMLSCTFKELKARGNQDWLLWALALCPIGTNYGEDEAWIKLQGIQNAIRGGYWVNGDGAGIFALGLGLSPEECYFDVGFRSVYYKV